MGAVNEQPVAVTDFVQKVFIAINQHFEFPQHMPTSMDCLSGSGGNLGLCWKWQVSIFGLLRHLKQIKAGSGIGESIKCPEGIRTLNKVEPRLR